MRVGKTGQYFHFMLVDFEEMNILQGFSLICPVHRIDVGVTHFT